MTTPVSAPPSTTWWATPPVGWSRVSLATYAAWRLIEGSAGELDRESALAAMAFGYAARTAYGARRPWRGLVPQLRLDWKASAGEGPWRRVRRAVKAGWTAGGHRKPSETASRVAGRPVARSHDGVLRLVHGGRLDRSAGQVPTPGVDD